MKTATMTMRRRLGVLFGAALIAVTMCATPTRALAANTANTSYNFNFSGTGATQGTAARLKTTSTVCYLRISYLGLNRMNFYIDGSKSASGSWVNRTRGGVATAYYTGHFSIHNYVNENGESYARLTAMSPSGSGAVSGMWSPDSNENNPSLN